MVATSVGTLTLMASIIELLKNKLINNNLENKQYPIIVLSKSWSKMSNDDIKRLNQ